MDQAHNTGQATYRLIVTRRNASEILLLAGESSPSLPRVEIRRGQRIAEQLTAELYAQWECRAYCLFVPARAAALPRCAVMEVLDPGDIASAGPCWKPLDVATCAAVDPAEDRTVIEKAIIEWAEYRRDPSQAPFTKPGWLSELLAWAQQQLGPGGPRLTGTFTQRSASPAFSLIRLETNDSAVWFKATGEPNRHEMRIATCVHRLFPGYVPEVLGIHPAWNGWLSREASGRTLGHGTELLLWLQAAEDLARLQILSIGSEAELLEGSCRNLKLPRLIEQIDPWIDHMRGLMAAQETEMPARLTATELTLVEDCLKQTCPLLAGFGFPDTLGHLDLNPGNIVVSPARTIFLDWAEGCVTNPLVAFEYFREHCERNCSKDTQATGALAEAYSRPWQPFFSSNALKQAMAFSPLVAVFAYAVGNPSLRSPESQLQPSIAGYSRSLARRMYRETVQIMKRSESCLA